MGHVIDHVLPGNSKETLMWGIAARLGAAFGMVRLSIFLGTRGTPPA